MSTNQEVENRLFNKLRELSRLPKSFTEILREVYFEMIDIFEANGWNNTRIISHIFNTLIHMNLHDVHQLHKSKNECVDSIKSQCELFFEFMYFRFGDVENLSDIIKKSLTEAQHIHKLEKSNTDYSKFLGTSNCLMLLKKFVNSTFQFKY